MANRIAEFTPRAGALARLDDRGSRTGPSATFHVRQAVESYIDDLEYAYALKAEAEAARRGEVKTRRLDEIVAELGLDA